MSSEIAILLVEDDESLGFVVKDNLELRGFRVDWVKDGQEGLNFYKSKHYNICLLDVMLPEKDGFHLANEIREVDQQTPILFLTAKAMQEDKLDGFRSGGDDYITKPFSMEELVFRINVFLKRTNPQTSLTKYQIGGFVFDYDNLQLIKAGVGQTLTQKEADVLKFFADNAGKVVKRESILKAIWGEDDYFMGRSLDVFISKLRGYLKKDSSVEIANLHGVGFKLITQN
ncbi:MAG: response regulator transcription factor [Bacteroidota bacterium]